jgi:hypothetical protein
VWRRIGDSFNVFDEQIVRHLEQPARAALDDEILQAPFRARVRIDGERLLQQRLELRAILLLDRDRFHQRDVR